MSSDPVLRGSTAIVASFAAVWGDGRLSSSDGQRFAAPPGTLIGAYHPRHFGYYDRAVSVYSHLSDRLGV